VSMFSRTPVSLLRYLGGCVHAVARRQHAASDAHYRGQRATRELEEAWIVQGLVRDDQMTQVEAAHLLGRHKSWVCRQLARCLRQG
jgi:hypothetical protein